MSDYGQFFQDTRPPFWLADQAAVTLASTAKALYPASQLQAFGAGYWWAGKIIRLYAFGKITTAATPGNGSFDIYWGSGADANGTIIGSSTATALIASQTNLSWWLDVYIECRAIGATGSLFCTGCARFNEAVQAAIQFIPASAAAAVTVDTSLNNILSIQYKRSGSTAEAMTIQQLLVQPQN